MSDALKSTLGYGLDVTHNALEIGADVLQFAPVPALQEAARVLLTIWQALELVEVSQYDCLHRPLVLTCSVKDESHGLLAPD